MRGRRLGRLALVSGVVVVTAALVTGRLVLATPNRLGPHVSETITGVPGPVGHRFTAFEGGFYPHGPDPVRVRAVRITGVPHGIRILAVHAVEGVNGGYIHGEPDPKKYDLRPVSDMVFREGEPERWGLAIIVEAIEPGVWETTGIDIDWKAGRHRGTSHFEYHVRMTVES